MLLRQPAHRDDALGCRRISSPCTEIALRIDRSLPTSSHEALIVEQHESIRGCFAVKCQSQILLLTIEWRDSQREPPLDEQPRRAIARGNRSDGRASTLESARLVPEMTCHCRTPLQQQRTD